MVSRKIYLLFYMLLMAAGYVAVYIFVTPLDLLQIISLLFLSLAFTYFYFLGEIVLMVFFLIIIMICLKTPKSEKVEADSGYEYPDEPSPAPAKQPEVINKEEQDTDEGVYDDDQDKENKS